MSKRNLYVEMEAKVWQRHQRDAHRDVETAIARGWKDAARSLQQARAEAGFASRAILFRLLGVRA